MSANKSKVIIVFLIAFLSLILRLGSIAAVSTYQYFLEKDSADYDTIALNLVKGRGFALGDDSSNLIYPTSRPPGYPFFLAGIYLLFGHNLLPVWIIQSFIGTFTCVVIFLIANKTFNFSTAVIAFLALSVYPPFIKYQYYGGPTFILTETLYTFLLSLSILSLVIYYKNKSLKKALVIGGFCFGISALTHSMLVPLPLFLVFWFFVTKGKNLNWKKDFLIFCFCFLLTVSPWTIRNYLVKGKFIPITSKVGESLWGGNNSLARGGIASSTLRLPEYNPEEFAGLDEVERDELKFRKGLEFLVNNPGKIPFLFFKKVLVLWSPINENKRINYPYLLIASLAFLYLWQSFFNGKWLDISLFMAFFVFLTCIAAVFAGDPRYRFPSEPYLIILASAFIVKMSDRLLYK